MCLRVKLLVCCVPICVLLPERYISVAVVLHISMYLCHDVVGHAVYIQVNAEKTLQLFIPHCTSIINGIVEGIYLYVFLCVFVCVCVCMYVCMCMTVAIHIHACRCSIVC